MLLDFILSVFCLIPCFGLLLKEGRKLAACGRNVVCPKLCKTNSRTTLRNLGHSSQEQI